MLVNIGRERACSEFEHTSINHSLLCVITIFLKKYGVNTIRARRFERSERMNYHINSQWVSRQVKD